MKLFSTICLALLILTNSVVAQQTYQLKESSVIIKGTSSLHDWESQVTSIDWSGTFSTNANQLTGVSNLLVKIPVTSIKSEHGKIMDNKTYEAFKQEKNPMITYRLLTQNISGSTISTKGELSMAGKTKQIEMNVKSLVQAGNIIKISGSANINMEDFGMEPPTAMMGAIKVGPQVEVVFNLVLTPGNERAQLNNNK